MKPWNNYAETKAYTEREQLPRGGYVVKILDCSEKQYNDKKLLLISFDIAEGEKKYFFKIDYNSQTGEDRKWRGTYRLWIPTDDGSEKDGWAKRRFKTVINAVEDSNEGYSWDWDEKGLKDKIVGAIYNYKEWEYNGKTGFAPNCYSLTSVDRIRENKFKQPEDTYLKGKKNTASDDDEFMNIPDGIDEELPFK